MKILIDNGHGSNTIGKCSPDHKLKEYQFCRKVAKQVVLNLVAKGYDASLLTPEDYDVSITTRIKRANAFCKTYGNKNVILISIHNNAAGNTGLWYNARGFSAHVALNASSKSKKLAQILWDEALELGLRGNRSVPEWKYIAQNLGICRETNCPAVLTENLFMDNKEDCEFLLSEKGVMLISALHVNAVIKYIEQL